MAPPLKVQLTRAGRGTPARKAAVMPTDAKTGPIPTVNDPSMIARLLCELLCTLWLVFGALSLRRRCANGWRARPRLRA